MAKHVSPGGQFPDLMKNVKPAQAQAHDHVHEQKPKRKKKELFEKRVPVLFKPSTVEALDRLAEEEGLNRNELIREIIENYLSDKN